MSQSFPGPIVITGANGGLGSTLVADLLAAGVTNLACQYRSSSDKVAKILEAHGLRSEDHLFRAELTLEEDVQIMEAAIRDRLGVPWGLVNLAGESTNGISWNLSLTDFNAVLQGNLVSAFLATRAFLPGMRQQEGGRIINISSILAHSGMPGASHYCAAKAGIEGFTRAVALEAASKKVTVNALALGYFDKGIIAEVPPDILEVVKSRTPLKRLGNASEIFPLVSYLLSPESAYMTGQVIHLNGGYFL
jgi:NAD(P)-dependent dehydrogenase (short-subunit alcohol dehydrogenase family)